MKKKKNYNLGIGENAATDILVYESAGCGNLAVHGGSLRGRVHNHLDSGEIFAVRMGRAGALPQLQVSATGSENRKRPRLPPTVRD